MPASERGESRDCIYIVFGCTCTTRAVAVKSGKIFQPLIVNRTAHIVAFCKKDFCNKTWTFYYINIIIFQSLLVNTYTGQTSTHFT